MQLILTGMGRELDFETGKEKGTLTFNKGLLRIQIDDDEMKRVLALFQSNPELKKTSQEKAPESDFYVHPGTVLDEDVKRDMQEYYVDQPLDSTYYDDEDRDDQLDEDGTPEL